MNKEFHYTECCGKVVLEQEEFSVAKSRYQGNGVYFCPRCDYQVTKTGRVKKPLNKVR